MRASSGASTAGGEATRERVRCPACRLGAAECLCEHLPSIDSPAKVVLLQHPREARNPLGTARLAHLALPGSVLLVGTDFERDPKFRAVFDAEAPRAAILFPAPDARPASELASLPKPLTLFAIDGTWPQAKKIYRENPSLLRLPAFRIEPRRPSAYVIREEPKPHCLSTLEALGLALDAVAGEEGCHEAILAPLHAMVARQLAHSQGPERTPRWRTRDKTLPRRPPRPPVLLEGAMERALLVYGEGNGFGFHSAEAPELVHWVALRPATGERFGAILKPARVADEVHHGLEPSSWARAASDESLRRTWREFVREDDVWCSWGAFPVQLVARTLGEAVPPFADLRPWVRARLGTRAGVPEAAVEAIPEAWEPGRAGRRLACMARLFEALRDR